MAMLAAGVQAASMAMENINVFQELEVCCRRVEAYARRSHASSEGKRGTASAGPRVWCVSVREGVCTVPYAPAACRVCAPAQLESERIKLEKKRLELEEEHLFVALPAPAASSTGAARPRTLPHPCMPHVPASPCDSVRVLFRRAHVPAPVGAVQH